MNINELIEIFENVNTSFNGKGVTQNSNSIYQSCIAFFGVYGEFTISFTDTTKNYTIVYPNNFFPTYVILLSIENAIEKFKKDFYGC